MNLPNKLTVLRIFMVPVCVFFLLMQQIPHANLWALIVFAAASLTDMLDGKIARKYHLVTNFGKLLDPLADKVLVTATMLCFIELDWCGAVPIILILAREFLVSALRMIALETGTVIAANIWGKIKTSMSMVAIIAILFLQELCSFLPSMSGFPVQLVCDILMWVAAALTVISGVIYMKDNASCIGSAK